MNRYLYSFLLSIEIVLLIIGIIGIIYLLWRKKKH